jgi:hypothetical protein
MARETTNTTRAKTAPTRQILQGFEQTKTGQNCWWWGGQVVPCKTVKCVLHIRREVKLDTFVNSVFHFTKGLVSRNATQLGTARLYMHFLQYWVQEYHLCS